jgi:hypothetical protein
MSMDESRCSERGMLPQGLSKIQNGVLVRIRSYDDMGVKKGIGDDIRLWILPVIVGVGLTLRVMRDPDHASEGAKSCLSMN